MIATRRSILAGLAGLPITSLPVTAVADPDAGLFALAARTLLLNDRFDVLDARASELDDRLDFQGPRRPPAPALPPTPKAVVEHRPDGSLALRMPAPSPERMAANHQHEAALASFEAERKAYARRIGLRAAERARDRADRRLKAAVEELTAMSAATLRGAATKARVAAIIDPEDDFALFTALRSSVLRDVIAIGGDA